MKIFFTLFLSLLFISSAFAQKQAEVIVTTTFLRQSPDSNSEKVQTVQKGEKVTFEKTQETKGWYYVSVSDGKVKGWIRRDTIGSITNAEKVKQKDELKQKEEVKQIPKANTQTVNRTPKTMVSPPTPNSSPRITATPNPTPAPTPIATPAAEPEEVLRIDTEEVSLNVRVVDGNNRPVSNLNQSHFKVYEDNVLQPITSLTTSEIPIITALVIDNSRSLRSQLEKIIEAGKIIVNTNRAKDESTVVRFVSKDKIEVVQDFTPNVNSLDNALDNLFVEGGQTAIIDAVYLTAKKVEQYQNSQKKEDVKVRALILITDGDDRSSSYKEQQLIELLRNSQVQVYAVGFVGNLRKESDIDNINHQEKAKAFLTELTQETGGKVYFPASIDELPQIASDISRELRTQYLISYTPTNENRDGSFRKINVVVADGATKEKRIAVTRTGRTAALK